VHVLHTTFLNSQLTQILRFVSAFLCPFLQLPAASDADARRALRRLQEVGVHVLAPAAEAAANPLPGVVAVMSLPEALAAGGLLRLIVLQKVDPFCIPAARCCGRDEPRRAPGSR
jgi:hypothetical protein